MALAVASVSTAASAQTHPAQEPFEITDNSFLVEEAFNQEPGVFQNILTWAYLDGSWAAGFTQEWPLFSMRHQLSYTVPASNAAGDATVGAILLHYRFQVLDESAGQPAFSPRFSLILPTGASHTLEDRVGLQVNLPFSKQRGDFYYHWNAGLTWLPRVPTETARVDLLSPQVAGSVIWRTRPMFNLMLETVLGWIDTPDDEGRTYYTRTFTVSPGFRYGWNLGDRQIVVGLASPITRIDSESSIGLLTYFSYEGPF